MTMRIIMRRGGEESFLVPIDNFVKCQSLCTYWNKVSLLESYHIIKVTTTFEGKSNSILVFMKMSLRNYLSCVIMEDTALGAPCLL